MTVAMVIVYYILFTAIFLGIIGCIIVFSVRAYKKQSGETAQEEAAQGASGRLTARTSGAEPKRHEPVALPRYSFTDAQTIQVRDAAFEFFPVQIEAKKIYDVFVSDLSAVMDTSVAEARMARCRELPPAKTEEERKDNEKTRLVLIVLAINESLEQSDPSVLEKKVAAASTEELLKAWNALDRILIQFHNAKNMLESVCIFRDYIQNAIIQREKVYDPVRFDGCEIRIDSGAYVRWRKVHPTSPAFEALAFIPITQKDVTLDIVEDGVKTRSYCLQTEKDEDFTGKFFRCSVRLVSQGEPPLAGAQIDGFVSDTQEDREMTLNDVGYRFEAFFLACGGDAANKRNEEMRRMDLIPKGLKYPGYTTPTNIRLVGFCADCGTPFAFLGYSCYMGQEDVAYSDDGQDACLISAYERIEDHDSWSCEVDGKTFRYYNSFCCPHCGAPYIDYRNHHEWKKYGVSACVHLGKKPLRKK